MEKKWKEIERKFLVKDDYKFFVTHSFQIEQGYLSSVPERTVRVRICGERAFITVKGESRENGCSRFEWEKEIELSDARELLKLCEPGGIQKTRHIVPFRGHVFEVDEFWGENEGLVVAEIELTSEDEEFERPDWLAEEVTGDERYYNALLVKRPFRKWS